MKSTRKTREQIDNVASEETAKEPTYSIKCMMPSIVGPTIILCATKEERAKHWQLNNDKPLIVKHITVSEVLVCANKCVFQN